MLLAAHGQEGAFGWVINGPVVMSLRELLERADLTVEGDVSGSVRTGGPVSPEQVWLVYRSDPRFSDLLERIGLSQ